MSIHGPDDMEYSEYRIIEETDIFFIGIGTLPGSERSLPTDLLEKYLVIHKDHGVVNYVSEVYLFASEWARHMEEALKRRDEIPVFPTPNLPPPDGLIN